MHQSSENSMPTQVHPTSEDRIKWQQMITSTQISGRRTSSSMVYMYIVRLTILRQTKNMTSSDDSSPSSHDVIICMKKRTKATHRSYQVCNQHHQSLLCSTTTCRPVSSHDRLRWAPCASPLQWYMFSRSHRGDRFKRSPNRTAATASLQSWVLSTTWCTWQTSRDKQIWPQIAPRKHMIHHSGQPTLEPQSATTTILWQSVKGGPFY